MKKSLVITVFVSAYLLFLLATIPASIIVSNVKLPNNILLGEVTGTVWMSEISAVQVDDVIIENVAANLSFLSLLLLNPSVELTFGDALVAGPEGKAKVSGLLSDLQIAETQINVQANEIAKKLTFPVDVTAHSFLDITINEFIAGKPLCSQLAGKLTWADAAITTFDNKVTLGDLSADLTCQQGEVMLTVVENNNLGLAFSAVFGQGGAMSGEGHLTPTEQLPEAIKQVLPFLGSPDQQGRYRIKL